MILAYVIILIVYLFCPRYLKLVFLVVNLFIPDPLPFLDEILIVAGLLKG